MKWVYDPKTAAMVPQKTDNIEIRMTADGLRVTDRMRHIVFVITRDDRIIFPQGVSVRRTSQLMYNPNDAMKVANAVRTRFPRSRYSNYRNLMDNSYIEYNAENESMTVEDKALLKSLSEVYESSELTNYINNINEGHIFSVPNAETSKGQTPGTTQHGIKGLVNAIPSFIVSFLVCPPAALLGYIGAVHERTQKRWLKTRINPVRWMDFVATPWEKKKEVADKIKEEMASNVEYYIATLANGEILRVVGATMLEAREMVEIIEKEVYIKRGENTEQELKNSNNMMWRATFDDGEITYICAPKDLDSRNTTMKQVQKDKDDLVDSFRHYYKEVTNKHLRGTGKETDEIRTPIRTPKANDLVPLDTTYEAITEKNYQNYTIVKGETASGYQSSYSTFSINIGQIPVSDEDDSENTHIFTFNVPVAYKNDLTNIMSVFKQKIGSVLSNSSIIKINSTETVYFYKCKLSNGDTYVLPCTIEENNDTDIRVAGSVDTNHIKQIKSYLDPLVRAITSTFADTIGSANLSKESIALYNKQKAKSDGAFSVEQVGDFSCSAIQMKTYYDNLFNKDGISVGKRDAGNKYTAPIDITDEIDLTQIAA